MFNALSQKIYHYSFTLFDQIGMGKKYARLCVDIGACVYGRVFIGSLATALSGWPRQNNIGLIINLSERKYELQDIEVINISLSDIPVTHHNMREFIMKCVYCDLCISNFLSRERSN